MADGDGIRFFVPLAQPNAICPRLSQSNFMPSPETYDNIGKGGPCTLFILVRHEDMLAVLQLG